MLENNWVNYQTDFQEAKGNFLWIERKDIIDMWTVKMRGGGGEVAHTSQCILQHEEIDLKRIALCLKD